eukprot:GEMP01024638.1.p1 GENE.GEMP01024638.1~~GEMP01024638.1.p1  ORF type:complete len:636 (+),score=101.87 GEMP01024638.1:28-1935(+)
MWILGLLGLVCLARGNTFTIGPNDRFWLDGKEFNIYSGSIHYSRVPREYWDDRLGRIKAMGLNAIQTYVPWNWHAIAPNKYDFTGSRDLEHFLDLCQKHELFVLLRPGPYICAEWNFGGFPPWLLGKTVRTYEKNYINEVDKWWDVLLPKMEKFLYVTNGGPILMVQLENEFGSYGDTSKNPLDKKYMVHLQEKAREHLGKEVSLYTTDGGNEGYISHGHLEGVYAVGDCGLDIDSIKESFAAMKKFNAKGKSPNLNSELYAGWLTHWTESRMQNIPGKALHDVVAYLVANDASFNLYMAHGGTNFGFTAGANAGGNDTQTWVVTSYDYSAPIAENGAHNFGTDNMDKYTAVQSVLDGHGEAPAIPCASYGAITFTLRKTRNDFANACRHWVSLSPTNHFPTDYFAVFAIHRFFPSAIGDTRWSRVVNYTNFADVLYEFDRNGVFITDPGPARGNTILRTHQTDELLDVVIENMGHIGFAASLARDLKGVEIRDPAAGVAGKWLKCFVSPEDIDRLVAEGANSSMAKPLPVINDDYPQPALFTATFTIKEVADTFLEVDSSKKGSAFVNGHRLGRYWIVGPQKRLYVPKPFLRVGENVLTIMEFTGPSGPVTKERTGRLVCRARHAEAAETEIVT